VAGLLTGAGQDRLADAARAEDFEASFYQWQQKDGENFVKFQAALALGGASVAAGPLIFGVSTTIGATSGGVSGYIAGGWKGAAVGTLVGGLSGRYGGLISSYFGDSVGGTTGLLVSTGTFVSTNVAGNVTATLAANSITPDAKLSDDLRWAAAIGLFAPLVSGEAFFVGAGGESAFGAEMTNAFASATGAAGVAGAVLDPNSKHTLNRGGK
jgi:hypothetical protein